MEGVLEEKREKMTFEERRQIREFELKRMRLANITDRASVSSEDLEGKGIDVNTISCTLWSDLVFDLRSYLDIWLAEMKVDDFVGLKELMLTEQLKKRVPMELVDHFTDSWEQFKDATILAEKLDHFETVKKHVERKIDGGLRDSGSSIDVSARSWIRENDLLGEYVWLKSPLDDVCHCLPVAIIKIKTKRGEFYTKAVIKPDGRNDDPYLLDYQTAELIDSSEQDTQIINAVVTRSVVKIHPTEVGKEIISRG
ncbi:integrase catalytic domain-containing protein [Nephila pilipes]|uniref:Integrase catalytic domain-containing protein n=1 Tax=Nephila pilipes TaxID=299642 RepID=A0A8X6QL20_NEPPI|nr:integrase catalytic domain-containing protein [Nephila pilipes]